MHSSVQITDIVPRFVRTLYDILNDEDPCILSWSVDGSNFQVFDVPRLERGILPKYFKHCKFASFQRQLNNFGFRKWTKTRASVCTFSHEFLHRCPPSQLAVLVAKMETQKAAMCAANSHIGAKRTQSDYGDARGIIAINLKRLHTESEEDEHEPEQEISTFSPENFHTDSCPLAGFDTADLCALDWSLVVDGGREDELNTLLEPILATDDVGLTESTAAITCNNTNNNNNQHAWDSLPPLDVEYLGDSWTDIFDEVAL